MEVELRESMEVELRESISMATGCGGPRPVGATWSAPGEWPVASESTRALRAEEASRKSMAHSVRLMDRSAPFGQSQGRVAVKRIRQGGLQKLPWQDPFHSLVHHSTVKIVAFSCLSYTITHFVFACVYYSIEEACDLQIKSFLDAFYVSLELGTTAGWGVPSPYFKKSPEQRHGCISAAGAILLHTLVMHVQNTVWIGVIYCRLSKGTKRACSVVFSERAVIREIGGRLYLMFQVCDARKHQLASAQVCCHALLWREEDGRGESQFEQRHMRLIRPDDELGSTLLLTFPALVVHEIDAWSPLAPPLAEGTGRPLLARRAADRDDPPHGPARADVEAFLRSTRVEVIVLVEGVEPVTSCTTQARYSYVNEDLAFDCAFATAVERERCGAWSIRYEKLQELVPAPPS